MDMSKMDKLVSLCKRRGFIFQSSEIYGGLNGFWDYGPLGVELKRNIKDAWWQDMVRNPPPGPDGQEISMVGVDCSIIMNPKVWVASGHVGGFQDPMVGCKAEGCKKLFRADKVWLVTIWPEGTVTNRTDVEASSAQPIVSDSRPSRTVAFHFDSGAAGVTSLAEHAIQAYGRKNNQAEFKRFVHAGTERTFHPSSIYFLGRNDGQAFECVIEPLLGAKYATSLRPCPECHTPGSLTDPRAFNLMFETHAGAVQSEENKVYLRPETAQGIFVNFPNVLDSSRMKLPFGIAQVGKAFRNEINPRHYTFRSREFEQMEIEFFCHPAESMKWYQFWRDLRKNWYTQLGIKSDRLRPREQGKEELAHYSIGCTDIEYLFPFSEETQELEGVAHRGAYDLTQHATHSGKDMHYFDDEAWERDKAIRSTNSFKEWLKTNPPKEEVEKYRFIPHVIEPSAGADRFTLAVLCEAYAEEEVNGEVRTVMRFHPRLAPIKAAIFPLVNKDGMPDVAQKIYRDLKKSFNVFYDDKGAVGRRYRRQDEAGTPYCITVDGQTLQDQTVTIRDRDTLVQERVAIKELDAVIRARMRS
jgi:glycyl-tRNA synthetase